MSDLSYIVLSEIQVALNGLGRNIKTARVRRRWSEAELARRMGSSRQTVQRIERGDPGISLKKLALALRSMGMSLDPLEELADPLRDRIGLAEEMARAPRAKRAETDPRDVEDFTP